MHCGEVSPPDAEAQRDLGPWKAGGKILSACAGKSWRDAVRHALRELLGHFTAFALVAPEGDRSVEPDSGQQRPWWSAFAAIRETCANLADCFAPWPLLHSSEALLTQPSLGDSGGVAYKLD